LSNHVERTFPDMPVVMPYDVKVGPSYGECVSINKYLESMV